MERLILVWFLVIAAGVQAGVMSVTGYYCRDPDTGKLHAANTTWPSTSFCGSYSCKLKKRNDTETKPFRQINITNDGVNIKFETNLNSTKFGIKSKDNGHVNKNYNTDKTSPLKEKGMNKIDANIHKGNSEELGDRYLTEPEIKALTELLHVVKKSDLEAIVELYNLAQDIYKELDVPADNKIGYETISKDLKGQPTNNLQANSPYKQHPSYWYEPLSNPKAKLLEMGESTNALPLNQPNSIPDISSSKITYPKDMQYEGSYVIPQLIQENLKRPNAYFKGPLSSEDIRKLPYYYPMSSFQRVNSYINPFKEYAMRTPNPQLLHDNIELHPNCKFAGHKAEYAQPPKVLKHPFIIEAQRKQATVHNNLDETDRKRDKPLAQLPYPFGIIPIQNYNTSYYPQNYINANPMFILDLYNKHHHIHVPSYVSAYIAQLPNGYLVTPSKVAETKDALSPEKSGEDKLERPNWQTDELSKSVIEEVKANIDSRAKLLPFPLRKMVKLEKVGKVIKIDELTRAKRFALSKTEPKKTDKQEVYDAYIEKSTCNSDTEPGFFRIGNESEPYPACCPQRINERSEKR